MSPLRLRKLNVTGFKAVDRLWLDVAPGFTLLIGMNGSGKSSILQAIGFARFVAEGRPQSFFDERGWDRQDLRFRSVPRGRSTLVQFGALFDSPWGQLRWEFAWGLNGAKLYEERFLLRRSPQAEIETVMSYTAKDGGSLGPIDVPAFLIDGSVTSILPNFKEAGEAGEIAGAVSGWARGIRSLELLAPPYMRGGTRLSPDDMGSRGDRLAGFLASLTADQKSRVVQRLGRVYPIAQLSTVKKRAGWIDLRVAERYRDLSEIPVAHMSDGFMRLLAICAIPELPDTVSTVLLDEIEDGIEPHILSRLVDLIRREARVQIVATSHSPLLVNGIPLEDIRVIGRRDDGRTLAANASNLRTFSKGAEYLGAGELWAGAAMEDLQHELEALANPSAAPTEAFADEGL